MTTQLIRHSILACCLVSPITHAGFFDALNDASKALETIESAFEKPTQQDQAPQKTQNNPQSNQSQQSQKPAPETKAKTTQSAATDIASTSSSNNFVNFSSGKIKLPYDQCPTTDILGIKLGQNISEIMPNSPFYFRKPRDSDAPTFEDRTTSTSFEEITVFSPKFESMRLDSLNRQYHYGFDQTEYNKIKELDKQGSRHGLNVWIDLKKGKDHPLVKDKHASYISLILDVNGDISSISVQRTLPVKISKHDVEEKLKAKYGEKRNPKDKNNQVIYLSSWGARVETNTVSMMSRTPSSGQSEQSIINYELSCVVAKRESKKHHKELRKKWQKLAESMRDNSGVSVDI